VRIIPLPENIHLEQLRVKVTGRNELVVKAPFIPREEMMQQKQYQRGLPCTWIPLEVTIKRSSIFGTQQQNKKCFPHKCYQHGQKTIFPMENESVHGWQGQTEWNKLKRKIAEGGLFQHHSTSTTLRTEYIRDEETGKVAMLVKVNVIGFRPEEVRVRVVESKRVLIVEATKRSSTLEMPMHHQQEQALTMKYLRREFILPQFLDVSHIAFRVLKTGVLAIKLPMLKNKQDTIFRCERQGCDVQDVEEPSHKCRGIRGWEKIQRV